MSIRHLGATLILLASGCASSPTLPGRDPAIAGPIVARDVQTSISAGRTTIHVKEDPADECGIIFTVHSGTGIAARTPDGRLVRAEVEDLVVGRRVSVWTTIILESCPAQAGADAIEILSD